ncbi:MULTISPECIES: hypothetical protein, partial [unclassified Bartonella]|uniref:hypothetical protein n=1 Tax=unclassified Bartonella TaxID=2645622 RepID=UPI0035CEBFD4
KNHSATNYTLKEEYFDYEREFGVAARYQILHKKLIKSIGFMQLFYMNPLKNPSFCACLN